jgi:hypothetical protein
MIYMDAIFVNQGVCFLVIVGEGRQRRELTKRAMTQGKP